LYTSPYIIRVNKSRKMKGKACTMYGTNKKCIYNCGQKTQREETTQKLGIDGHIRTILGKGQTGCIWLRMGTSGGPF
jgi:hypothetical protein